MRVKVCECGNVFGANACFCSEHDSKWGILIKHPFCGGHLYDYYIDEGEDLETVKKGDEK